jgi:hypothetical protein
MEGLNPHLKCGGEVEVIKLNEQKKGKPLYRIECRRCRALVAKGTGFPEEPERYSRERIHQYNEIMAVKYGPLNKRG